MLLTIDVGNSQIHAGLFSSKNISFQFRYTTAQVHDSSDQLGVFLRQVLRENSFSPEEITDVAVSSVVPAINYSLRAAIYKYFDLEPFFLLPDSNTGLKINVATPKEVGADRIAACIAAVELFPCRNILIIDLGTATVFDVVTKNKEYLSGAILPGVRISAESLSYNTAQLSSVSIVKPCSVIGKDTDTNIQSGIYYGHLGAMKNLKHSISSELDDDILTIATGGFSQLFNQEGLFDIIISDLVLQGIKIAYKKAKIQ